MENFPTLWIIGSAVTAVCGLLIVKHCLDCPLEKSGTTRGILTMLTGKILLAGGSLVFIIEMMMFFHYY